MTLVAAHTFEGTVVGISTNNGINQVQDLISGALLCQWKGNEITAVGTCADRIVCAALDGKCYMVNCGQVQEIRIPHDAWINAVCSLSDTTCLLGGNHGLVLHITLTNSAISTVSLSQQGIRKPGRDILGLVSHGHDACFILGKKELLLSYNAGKIVTCVDSRTETFLSSGVSIGTTLWMSCRRGSSSVLGQFNNGALSYQVVPFDGMEFFCMAQFNERLLIGTDTIYLGLPNTWSAVGKLGEGSTIGFCALRDGIYAVGYTGKCIQLAL